MKDLEIIFRFFWQNLKVFKRCAAKVSMDRSVFGHLSIFLLNIAAVQLLISGARFENFGET